MASETARAIEAILMVAEQPVPVQLLAQLLEAEQDAIQAVLDELMASYEVEDRGFILTKVAGGYRYQSHPDLAPYVERFVLEGQTARLSAAALETLAIVAYKQPISRAQIAAIRGVNVDGVVRTLEQRGYIAEVARDPGPGNPSLFGTTDVFLEKLGLASLDDLPPIAAFVPGPDVVEQLEQGLRAEVLLDVPPAASGDATDVGGGDPAAVAIADDAEVPADDAEGPDDDLTPDDDVTPDEHGLTDVADGDGPPADGGDAEADGGDAEADGPTGS